MAMEVILFIKKYIIYNGSIHEQFYQNWFINKYARKKFSNFILMNASLHICNVALSDKYIRHKF